MTSDTLQVEVTPHPMPWIKAILFSLGISALLVLSFVSMVFGSAGRGISEGAAEFILFCIAAIGFAIGGSCLLSFRQKGGEFSGILSLGPDAIRWRPARGQTVEIPYGELWKASITGQGTALLLEARKDRSIVVKRQSLPSPDLVETLLRAVLDRVENLPDGQRLRALLESRRAGQPASALGGMTVTLVIASILALVFLTEVAMGALKDTERLLAFGANSPELVAKGELFRLATANLLHGGWIHLLMNFLALFIAGSTLEHVLGKSRFLTFFLASSLAGAALSAWLGSHRTSFGASSGISGLMAAYIILHWKWKDQVEQPVTKPRLLLWALMILVSGGRRVDHLAHLGGFIAGCLLMMPALQEAGLSRIHLQHPWLYRVTAGVLVAVFLVAAAMVPLTR